VVEVNERVRGPDPFLQFLAWDYFSRLFQKNLENLKGLLLEPDLRARAAEFSCVLIQFEIPELNCRS
jgi:hypothetical protein